MSIIAEVLKEEYEKLLKTKKAMEKEIEKLPRGYISEKRINGKIYQNFSEYPTSK